MQRRHQQRDDRFLSSSSSFLKDELETKLNLSGCQLNESGEFLQDSSSGSLGLERARTTAGGGRESSSDVWNLEEPKAVALDTFEDLKNSSNSNSNWDPKKETRVESVTSTNPADSPFGKNAFTASFTFDADFDFEGGGFQSP